MAEEPAETSETGTAADAVSAADPGSPRAAYDRGRFLTGATIGLGGVMGAVIAVPSLGFVLAPAWETVDYYWSDLGPAENFKDDEANPWTPVIFQSRPDPRGSGLFRRVAFVRNKGGEFSAISNNCMHLGCPVQAFGSAFACPCHGGQYDGEGRRTAGPPARPLNRYETKVENGHLFLGKVYAVNDDLERQESVKPPGVPADGLISLLYPPAPS